MKLGFEQPLWLAMLLIILPLVWRMHQLRHARHLHKWFIFAALGLTILALTRPYLRLQETITIAIDLSASTKQSPWREPMWVRDLARARLPEHARVRVVGFGSQTTEFWHGRIDHDWPERWGTIPDENQSDLSCVLASDKPTWVITDGYVRWPDKLSGQLAATMMQPVQRDFGIRSVRLGEASDQPSRHIWIEVSGTGKGIVQLICRSEGKILWQRAVIFDRAGSQWIQGDAAKGLLQLQLVTNDPWPEDDTASIVALTSESSQPLMITPKRALRENLAELMTVPLVVFDGVSGADMTQAESDTLRRYVEQTGGGVLLVGGKERWEDTLAKLSPLTHENPKREKLNLWFLIDSSGSMAQLQQPTMTRRDVAIEAVTRATEMLRNDDRVNLMLFNQHVQEYRRDVRMADALLKSEPPTGATYPDCMLENLERDLEQRAIVVLLTDGEIPQMDVARWQKLLSAHDAKLIIVAPMQAGQMLNQLAAGHHWAQAQKPEEWRMLLRQIVSDSVRRGERRDDAIQWKYIGEKSIKGITRPWVESWAKPMAQPRAQSGDFTLAATWRVGLGQVAAVSFVDASRDAEELKKNLMQEVRAADGDRRFILSAQQQADGWYVQVDACDENRWMNGLHLEIRSGDARVAAKQIAPGRYEAQLPHLGQSFPVFVLVNEGKIAGRLAPAMLPLPEAPAVAQQGAIPDGVSRIDVGMGPRWRPTASGKWDVSPWLWIAAGVCLVTAMGIKIKHGYEQEKII